MINIKSTFILSKVFSIIDEQRKLELMKYNKRIQSKVNINILNYKLFGGKYIIYEEKGIGEEYDGYTNNLIYEGEFLKGKRSGKGKEYNKEGNMIFEGTYLNGKKMENVKNIIIMNI